MNKSFNTFLEKRIRKDELDTVLSQIDDIENLTVRDLKFISNKTNKSYEAIVDMYLDGILRYHHKTFIREALENHDIEALRRVILERHLLVSEDKVILKPVGNKLRKQYLDDDIYQQILHDLIEAGEIELAHVISYGNNYYRDYNSSLPNIVDYLVGNVDLNEDLLVQPWLSRIYKDLSEERKLAVHDRIMEQFEKSYDRYLKFKDCGRIQYISNAITILIHDDKNMYHQEIIEIPEIYKQFPIEDQKKIIDMFNLDTED